MTNGTQLRAALALTELVSHPDLRAVSWTVAPEGVLSGYLITEHGAGEHADIAAVLMGSGVERDVFRAHTGEMRGVATVRTVWRDVVVTLSVTYPLRAPQTSSPAKRLADSLSGEEQVQAVEVDGHARLSVVVTPDDITAWSWWVARLGIEHETLRGGHATGTGRTACGVEVRLLGVGVGRLATRAALAGGVR
ncbi:hypothetical protein [Streptomyces sulphureus]|uniref:hypothetical protein n=1 Tax=Streptomyces sulphureus TaxID=47758 RepID=UPI00035EA9FA|nr:hypothetical protein [Streptomyces sulphureus]